MIDFIGKRIMAGLLAAVFVCGVLLAGCASKPGGSGSLPPAIVGASSSRYAVNVEDSDAPSEDAVRYLLNFEDDRPAGKSLNTTLLDFCVYWLDIDTLTREIAYANALVRAYKDGSCPEEVAEEAAFLAYLKAMIEIDDPTAQVLLANYIGRVPHLWAFVIAELDSLYQYVGEYNSEGYYSADDFDVTLNMAYDDDYVSFLHWLSGDCTNEMRYYLKKQGQELPQIDGVIIQEPYEELRGTPYTTAALLHEACCEYDHSAVGEVGYVRCSSLDERETYIEYYWERYYEWKKTTATELGGFTDLAHFTELRTHGWSIDDHIKDGNG